jgi:hypothetical protein
VGLLFSQPGHSSTNQASASQTKSAFFNSATTKKSGHQFFTRDLIQKAEGNKKATGLSVTRGRHLTRFN